MIHPKLSYHQSGVALILSLLLLFILTLVAVSSFTSSHVQERAASNSRLQTMAFEAAAAGAANSIDFFVSHVSADAPDTLCGQRDHTGWGDPPTPTAWREVTYATSGVRLKQRMYCLNDEYPDPGGGRPPRSQLFVASRGEVDANGSVVAFREVEVRIAAREDIDARGCGALCFPACDPLYDGDDPLIDFPSSNAFQVDGGGGPAVTTGIGCDDPTLLDTILDDLNSNRLGNYDGGLQERDPGSPWNSPHDTDVYRAAVETAAQVAPNNYIVGDLIDNGHTVYGTIGAPEITYVTGNLDFGGNISGAGIIMVEGDIYWNGTPDFQGLIVTLGGTYTIDGGGLGGNHAGSVVVLNNNGQSGCAASNSCTEFGGVSWDNTGGGTAEYNWDCGALEMAYGMVDDGVADNDDAPWGFECDGRRSLFDVPDSLVIASWRENLGWRETYFAAE